MTTFDVARALLRCWSVVLLGALLTGVGLLAIKQHDGVYWTQVDVVFIAPPAAQEQNAIMPRATKGLIATAGLVERKVNEGRTMPATSSAAVTLVGRGVRDGWQVRLPNSGGQWTDNYDRPVLDVQVAGGSPDQVQATLKTVVGRINATLRDMQATDGVPPKGQITTQLAPTRVGVFFAGGQPMKAMAMTLLLGVVATVVAAVRADAMLTRYGERRSRLRREEHASVA